MCEFIESSLKKGDHTTVIAHFRQSMLFPIVDNETSGRIERFKPHKTICTKFKFLWSYLFMINDDLEKESTCLVKECSSDFTTEIVNEIKLLKKIHQAKFRKNQLTPLNSFT